MPEHTRASVSLAELRLSRALSVPVCIEVREPCSDWSVVFHPLRKGSFAVNPGGIKVRCVRLTMVRLRASEAVQDMSGIGHSA